MDKKIFMIFAMFLCLIFSVSAIKVEKSECFDDGSFEITLKADSEKYAYTRDMIISIENRKVSGLWDNDKIIMTDSAHNKYATFIGPENYLNEKKSYPVHISYKLLSDDSEENAELNFELECPGLVFTCHKMNIRIKDCVTSKEGKFTANMEIHGLEQSSRAIMNPLDVVDFILQTPMLYKDIKDFTSRSGSLPVGSIITKTGKNEYKIEAQFPEYTTNHVQKMWAKFNPDNLFKPCNPIEYPNAVFSSKKECQYIETEKDEEENKEIEMKKIKEEKNIQEQFEKKPKEEIKEETNVQETKQSKELEVQKEQNLKEGTKELKEEPKNTGYSVKEAIKAGQEKKKSRLKTLIFLLIGVLTLGGGLLMYLYKQGYFY